MLRILTALALLISVNFSYSQTTVETPVPNNQPIEFKAADGTTDGTLIKRASGGALRLMYANNFLIFDALTDHAVQIRNSSDQTKVLFNPNGHSYFNGGNLGLGTSTPTERLEIVGGNFRISKNAPIIDLYESDNNHSWFMVADGNNWSLRNNGHNVSNQVISASSTGNVGIGTSNPTFGRLQVNQQSDASDQGIAVLNSTGQRSIRIWADNTKSYISSADDGRGKLILNGGGTGYVGIGTNNPSSNLHIMNNVEGENVQLILQGTKNATTNPSAGLQFDPTNDVLYLSNGNYVGVSVNNYGNVGIGMKGQNNNFGYMLAVNGTIGAKEVIVENTSAWPDYVFKPEYQLTSLDEVKKHIDEKGHLLNIPSAKQVEENGISLGEMNRLLLEKVEELTLYMLEQNTQLKAQQNQIQMLTEKIQNLKK